MNISDSLLPEFDHEMGTTRRVLERVSDDQFGYTPHAKSMTMGKLACHVAGIPFFGKAVANGDSLDFAKGQYEELQASNNKELLAGFDKTVADARAAIAGMSNEEMMKNWALQMNGQTIMAMPKVAVIRTVLMNHLLHHRGQLSVYLRLTNTPVPSIYGPSADEGGM